MNPPSSESPPPDEAERAVKVAEQLLRATLAVRTRTEAAHMQRVARLIENPESKSLSMAMTDRLFRSDNASRAAWGWRGLLRRFGISEGFAAVDRLMLRLGAFASRILPWPVIAAVRHRLRDESDQVILPAEDPALSRYLDQRRRDGERVNLNQLGEAVLGEEEAQRRMDATLALLARADVDYVSVKISAIFSQINLVAWQTTLDEIKARLRRLYRAALPEAKFVNLDMEEYRDLALTVAAFREVLDEEEFGKLSAGIVLQAYLPDSIAIQRELTTWARQRVAAGDASIKIRIVKGANLAMERVEAEWHGWTQAPHPDKATTDAGFKRMLEFACQPENAAAVRVGVGSHNLFDIALALVLREQNSVADRVEIEMLEGMAPAQARAVNTAANGLLLYAPLVKDADFGSALAYLIRRLDENTTEGNFLADLFSLRPGSDAWHDQKQRFLDAWQARHGVSDRARRATLPPGDQSGKFSNQPDSDWTLPATRSALAAARLPGATPPEAGASEIAAALTAAKQAQPAWEQLGDSERARILRQCAEQLQQARFESIAVLRDEGKKAVAEADTEISEAIDFARYYAQVGGAPDGVNCAALGTVVVAPPWNFPFAIPCGGVLAALMAGNAVILKPAPESVRIGWWLAQQLWAAGVPRDVLHFVACADGEVGRKLIVDERSDAVILTGAYETARKFQDWRPSLKLFAETSGKNAIVVSALADRELAARDLVRSAFGHSGQKCSAASLGILEAEVYDDPVFRRQLRDAAASLPVGPASDLSSVVTPLVQFPGKKLARALTELDDGESWLLQPVVDPDDPCRWSPGIKLGVKQGSWFHQTECFGPVLGLMRADDLDQAVQMQNDVPYGLTAGFHSLDETEIERWQDRVEAGNLYINRGITGAIVQRQPFGGWKKSSIGPGAKAGGPNYVNLLRTFSDFAQSPADRGPIDTDYHEQWHQYFSIAHDPGALRCESNRFRYRPRRGVIVRLPAQDRLTLGLLASLSSLTGVPVICSHADEEDDAEFAARLTRIAVETGAEIFRSIDPGRPPADKILRGVHDAGLNWIDAPLSTRGRIELPRWMREQSVTETRHRYGNILPNR